MLRTPLATEILLQIAKGNDTNVPGTADELAVTR